MFLPILSLLFPLYVLRYCSKLPGDQFFRPKPVYIVEEYGKDYYICKLQLPINCQLRESVLVSSLSLDHESNRKRNIAVFISICQFIVGSVSSLDACVMMS